MPVCIAGAITSGHVASSNVVDRRSSASPWASFAITFAVAGATTATSASCARRTWRTSPGRSHRDEYTGSRVSAANVSGPMNRVAFSVRITETSAPASSRSRATSAAL
jgi:hypothetical protein